MGSVEQIFPSWLVWMVFAIGYFVCARIAVQGILKVVRPLWQEAQAREKRIELASAAVAILALLISAVSLAYTIRQVDSMTDRLGALEKTLDAMKAKSDTTKP